MNYYDAMQIRQRAAQRQPVDAAVLAEANAFIERNRAKPSEQVRALAPLAIPADKGAPVQPKPTAEPVFIANTQPGMDVPCICGRRAGMHRINDYACPNAAWRPGNGEPQWHPTEKFTRA